MIDAGARKGEMGDERPRALVAVLVMGIAIGGMGFCSSGLGIVRALTQAAPGPSSPARIDTAHVDLLGFAMELERQVEVALAPLHGLLLAEAFLGLLACFLLLVGATRALRMREGGRRVFLAALGAGAATGLFRVSLGVKVNEAIEAVVRERMLEVSVQAGVGAAEVAPLLEQISAGATFVSVGVSAAWLAIELVYFGGAAWYLTRPRIRRLYGASAG